MWHSIKELITQLGALDYRGMYLNDFLLTWNKSDDELRATFLVAEILRGLRRNNISSRIFDSGLAVSLFRDQSTRTRFSFASACNLLGLEVQDLDEGKSQIAHGETVRETATMVSFMADVIGIRDDMYIGKGHTYMLEVAEAVKQGFLEGRPGATAHPGQFAVRYRPPYPEHGGHAAPDQHFRRRGESQGQKDRHDVGLQPLLRKASVRTSGRDRPYDPLRHGRGLGSPKGIRGHA